MTETAHTIYDVIVIVGSEKSDVPVVIASGMLQILTKCGVRWRLAAISAHRHAASLRDFINMNSPCVFICAVGMMPGLPGTVAAHTYEDGCPVIGVALANAEVDPDGSKALGVMALQPPGVPVLVAGVGKAGLINAAHAATQMIGLTNLKVRDALERYIQESTPSPSFNIQVPDTTSRKESHD